MPCRFGSVRSPGELWVAGAEGRDTPADRQGAEVAQRPPRAPSAADGMLRWTFHPLSLILRSSAMKPYVLALSLAALLVRAELLAAADKPADAKAVREDLATIQGKWETTRAFDPTGQGRGGEMH